MSDPPPSATPALDRVPSTGEQFTLRFDALAPDAASAAAGDYQPVRPAASIPVATPEPARSVNPSHSPAAVLHSPALNDLKMAGGAKSPLQIAIPAPSHSPAVAAAAPSLNASALAVSGLSLPVMARNISTSSTGSASGAVSMPVGMGGMPQLSGVGMYCFRCSKLRDDSTLATLSAAGVMPAAPYGSGASNENGLKWLELTIGSELIAVVLSYLGPKHSLLLDHTLASQITHTIHGCEHAGDLGARLEGIFSLLIEQVTLTQTPNSAAASMTALTDLCSRFIEQSKGVARMHTQRLAREQRMRAGLADAKLANAYVSLQRTINLWVPIVRVSGRYKIMFHEQQSKLRQLKAPATAAAVPRSRSRSNSKHGGGSGVGSGSAAGASLVSTANVDMLVQAAYYELARSVKYKNLSNSEGGFKVAFEFDVSVLYPAGAPPANHTGSAAVQLSGSTGTAVSGSGAAAVTPTEPTTPRSFFSKLLSPKPAPPPPAQAPAASAAPAVPVEPLKSLFIQMADDLPPIVPPAVAGTAADTSSGGAAPAKALPLLPGAAVVPGAAPSLAGGTVSSVAITSTSSRTPHSTSAGAAFKEADQSAASLIMNTIRTEPHGNLRGLLQSREFRALVPAIIPLVDAIDQQTMKVFLVHVYQCGITAAGVLAAGLGCCGSTDNSAKAELPHPSTRPGPKPKRDSVVTSPPPVVVEQPPPQPVQERRPSPPATRLITQTITVTVTAPPAPAPVPKAVKVEPTPEPEAASVEPDTSIPPAQTLPQQHSPPPPASPPRETKTAEPVPEPEPAPKSAYAFAITASAEYDPNQTLVPESYQQKRWACVHAALSAGPTADGPGLSAQMIRLILEYASANLVYFTGIDYDRHRTQLAGLDISMLERGGDGPRVLVEYISAGADASPAAAGAEHGASNGGSPNSGGSGVDVVVSPGGSVSNNKSGVPVGSRQNRARLVSLDRLLWILHGSALSTYDPFSGAATPPKLARIHTCDEQITARDEYAFAAVGITLPPGTMDTTTDGVVLTTAARRPALFITGGQQRTENATTYLHEVDRFDITDGVWSSVEPMSEPRASHTSVVVDDRFLYVIGGVNSDGILTAASRYDPVDDIWTQLSDMTESRYGHAACVVHDWPLHLFSHPPSSGAVSLHGAAGSGSDERRSSLPLSGVSNACIVVSGGISGGMSKNSCELYDPRTDSWMSLPLLNSRLYNHAMCWIDRKLYVIGSQLKPTLEVDAASAAPAASASGDGVVDPDHLSVVIDHDTPRVEQPPPIEYFDPFASTHSTNGNPEWVTLNAVVPGRVFAATFI